MTPLVNGAPEIGTFAVDREEDFVQVPLVTGSGAPAAELIGIGLPELPAPIPHGFVGQDDPTFRHQLLNIPVAQAEAEVQPHAMANNLRRKPMALVRVECWWCIHAASMPYEGSAGKRGN